ncbi:hypothetical protein H8F22_21340 [Pseudomonas sp. P154a]|uniref:hypothetical protein n=1 Tax=Pseudomonas mucoides TaxID=2730424 RepID=UPI00189258F4|nr:hypothetical protein [Pseudomonas mucoides]MBF6041430.1 hypothetical protein [Pseudomonas mucoides]
MQHPIVGDSWGKALARSFIKFSESWLIKSIVKPLVFILPPTLLTTLATRQGLSTSVTKYLSPDVAAFINDSAAAILLGAYIYIIIVKSIYSLIKNYSKPSRELSIKDIIAINKAFEIIVSDKYKRMSDEAKNTIKSNAICPTTTFLKITKPDQQIALLIGGIRSIFEHLDESNAHFRVGLLRITNNKPTDWVCFEPISHPPRTEPGQLSAPSSAVSTAIRKKCIVVIEDIQRELLKTSKDKRRFLAGNTQINDQGSQLCYPITHASTGKIEYVITIAGNKKSCLIEKHAELYAWILEQFSLRISLEHSLLILKEKANEHQRAA